MKKLLFFLLASNCIFAQNDTEIFLYKLTDSNTVNSISGANISNNAGYDSQPHFYSKKEIVFSSNRNKYTDIAKYDIESATKSFLNKTPYGGEYSPQRIPGSKNISAVRLDDNGLQRLYEYNIESGESKEIIADLKVAYPFWYAKNSIIHVAIVGDDLDLLITDLNTSKHTTIQKKVGRSLHKIPNSELVSYVSKTNDIWSIKSLNPKTGETKLITDGIGKNEDVCWLPNGTLLIAYGSKIMKYHPKTAARWTLFHDFTKNKHKNISRITVNASGTLLVLVSE